MSSTSPSETLIRKQKSLQPSPMPEYYDEESQKENSGSRKALPTIPLPPSGRLHGSPMSPVRVNVQSEGWSHQPSTAELENGYSAPQHYVQHASTSEEEQRRSSESSGARLQNMTHRQHHENHSAQPIQQARAAEMASADAAHSSRTPALPNWERYGASSSNGSAVADNSVHIPPVPPLQYHHYAHESEGSGAGMVQKHHHKTSRATNHSSGSNQNSEPHTPQHEAGMSINRHVTPTLSNGRRSVVPRPASAYSLISDFGPRGQSPSWTPRTASTGRSPDNRPLSYIDLLNVPYAQQQAPAPISFDNSQLRAVVGTNASLLSAIKTLDMYRANAKKATDPETLYTFAMYLIQASHEFRLQEEENGPVQASPKTARDLNSPYIETLTSPSSSQDLLREARQILTKLADRSYPFAQYYLADGYASGFFNKGKEDYDRAFALFVSASKHGHAESGYRAALCYEFGWGCRRDITKAVQFYRQSASKSHPGAMTRLGRACLSGDLGMSKYREGLKWLKRAQEDANIQYNAAPYHLGILYETGYGDDVFKDEVYAAQLFTQAADLGHAEASYRLGDAYEHGNLSCPQDPALSIHFYTGAAQRGHPAAMMALCAWYMVGAEPILEKDEAEAFEWANRAAELGLTKAEYAVGFFKEMGIGCRRDPLEANVWYVRAADAGDERAKHRLSAIRAAASGGNPMMVAAANNSDLKKVEAKDDKECIVM